MCQRSSPAVPDDATVVDDLLEFGSGFFAVSRQEISFAANVGGIEAGKINGESDLTVLDGRQRRLHAADRRGGILAIQGQLRSNRGEAKGTASAYPGNFFYLGLAPPPPLARARPPWHKSGQLRPPLPGWSEPV